MQVRRWSSTQAIGRFRGGRVPASPPVMPTSRAQRRWQCVLAAWSPGAVGAIRIAAFRWQPGRVVDSDAETLRALLPMLEEKADR